jgi:hypothetical protein
MNGDGGTACSAGDCHLFAVRGDYTLKWGWQWRGVVEYSVSGPQIIASAIAGIVSGYMSENDQMEQDLCSVQCGKAPGTWTPTVLIDCAAGPGGPIATRSNYRDQGESQSVPGNARLMAGDPVDGFAPYCHSASWPEPYLAGVRWQPDNYPWQAAQRRLSGRQISSLHGSIEATCVNTDLFEYMGTSTGFVKSARVTEERLAYFPESELSRTLTKLHGSVGDAPIYPSDFPHAALLNAANSDGPFPAGPSSHSCY